MSVHLREHMSIDELLLWREGREFRWNDMIGAGFTRKGIDWIAERLIATESLRTPEIDVVPMTEPYAGSGLADQAIARAG